MPLRLKLTLFSRVLFFAGGLVVFSLVACLLWVGLTAPLNARLPVPSPDGKYFAYFGPVETTSPEERAGHDLIVSTPGGRLMARFRMDPGSVQWSNADHLCVVDESRTSAILIANAEGRLVVLSRVILSQGTEPRWSRDGNKLACVRPGPAGDQIAIYNIQEPQALPIPLAPEFHLSHPELLFWSPSSEYLFFLNEEGQDVVLERVEVVDGVVNALAQGISGGRKSGRGLPQMSPDGTKIFLNPPRNCVIDAETGATLWVLPQDAEALWSPWSGEGRRLFYFRAHAPAEIIAHDFSAPSDQLVVSGVQPNGFFTLDGRSYFFRTLQNPPPYLSKLSLHDWLEKFWGWQQTEGLTASTVPLGRVEFWPWEQTLDGSILARQDDYARVRIGLYDPDARVLEEFVFPTAEEDLLREIRSHRLLLLTVALYALLAFAVFWKGGTTAPGRAFYFLTVLLIAFSAGQSILNGAASIRPHWPFRVASGHVQGLGWWTTSSLYELVLEKSTVAVSVLWALLPAALMHLAVVFPEGNRLLARRKAVSLALYGVAFLPLVGVLMNLHTPELLEELVRRLLIFAGGAAGLTWILTLTFNYRYPPDRRSREQIRWVMMAFGLVLVGAVLLLLVHGPTRYRPGPESQRLLDMFRSATLALIGWLAPLAVAYALAAQKPYNLPLLFRRVIQHLLMGLPALVIFLLLWAGVNWVMTGSFLTLSPPVIFVAVLLTVFLTMPFRGRLRVFVDRTFDRLGYERRERLMEFARGLRHILDRQTLAARLGETLPAAMGTQRFFLFGFDRHAKKLRLQPAKDNLVPAAARVEFDPSEPLGQYLLSEGRPFEVEVSPYSTELIPILRSAADRLGRLEAALILGLKRRDELLGLMVMGVKTTGEFYSAEDLELLLVVAREAAAAAENIDVFDEAARDRELRKELEDAAEVQAQLLPRVVPHLVSGGLTGRCSPAPSASGDYYDFLELPGRKIGLAIGDVSGRGMSASLLMANLQSLLRTQAVTADNLGELLGRINRQLYRSAQGAKFCTLFYGIYDDATRQFEFVNAGHSPPLVLTAKGARFLESTGLPLGLFPEIIHNSRHEMLEPGAIMVLYSDGVTEARNGRGEIYGVDRLINAVSCAGEDDVERLATRIMADLRDFERGTTPEDDQTLVVLKTNPA